MKRSLSLLFALAVAAALVVLIATIAPTTSKSQHGLRPVYAQSGCTDTTLTGNYAVIGPGFVTPAAAKTVSASQDVPIAIVGVLAFDGAGKVSFTFTLAVNGVISQGLTSSGAYTVNSDCTGSISFTSGAAAGVAFNTAIIGGGTEVFAIQTNSGTTATFDAKKQ